MQENDSLAYLSKYVMFFSEHQLKILKITRTCSYIWRKAYAVDTCSTVEPPIADLPNSGLTPYSGRYLWHGFFLPFILYINASRIAAYLRIPNSDRSERPQTLSLVHI